jgi:hypothetical protein
VQVVNDIKSNPKLSVVGKVMVGPNTFLDNSNTIKNLSVMAFKGRNNNSFPEKSTTTEATAALDITYTAATGVIPTVGLALYLLQSQQF